MEVSYKHSTRVRTNTHTLTNLHFIRKKRKHEVKRNEAEKDKRMINL